MPEYAIGNFSVYAVMNAITPGLGNILALNAMGSYGWKEGKPLLSGIFAGCYTAQILCTVFVFSVSIFLPNILRAMKYVDAAHILWLVIHIAISEPADSSGEKSASFIKGFLLQLVNAKICLSGTTALTGHIADYSTLFSVLFVAELTIAAIGTIAALIQIGLGTLFRTMC